MKLLWYFARAYVGVLALMEAGLVVIVLATTFVENAGVLTRVEGARGTVLGLALYGSIQFGHQVLPVACFLAALVSGTLLARSGELLAVQAAGVSTMRLALAFAGVAVAAALVGGLAGEYLVPRATSRFEELEREQLGRGSDDLGRFYDRRTQWFREGELLLYIPRFDPDSQTFTDVAIYRFRAGLIAEVIDGTRLAFRDGEWWIDGARIHRLSEGLVSTEPELRIELRVSPADLAQLTGDPRTMRSAEVRELIERRKKAGFEAAAHVIELHNRIAFPLSALCMFVLAIPWSLDPNRRRSLAVDLGAGVAAVAVLLFSTQVFRLLGLARKIPPPLGAWGIDLVCLAAAPVSLWLYRRHRTRGGLW